MGRAARIMSPVELRALVPPPPWLAPYGIVIRPELAGGTERDAPEETRRVAALEALANLPQADVRIWSDGSAYDGVKKGQVKAR
jgi:hypothetical protein